MSQPKQTELVLIYNADIGIKTLLLSLSNEKAIVLFSMTSGAAFGGWKLGGEINLISYSMIRDAKLNATNYSSGYKYLGVLED